MSTLKIAMLGPPEVEHRGYRLTFSERKALALLAYLGAEGGMHERQRLTGLLWPESDMARGRTMLRITLLHLPCILTPHQRFDTCPRNRCRVPTESNSGFSPNTPMIGSASE